MSTKVTTAREYGIEVRDQMSRHAALDWIEREGCDYAMTLAFNRQMHFDHACQRMSEWLYAMDQMTRGVQRAHRLPIKARLFAFIVPEHVDSNIHFHLAVKLVDGRDVTQSNVGRVLRFAYHTWMAIQPGGSFEAKRIDDLRGWGRYITKDSYTNGSELMLSHDFLSIDSFKAGKESSNS